MKFTQTLIESLKCSPDKPDMLVFDDEQRGLRSSAWGALEIVDWATARLNLGARASGLGHAAAYIDDPGIAEIADRTYVETRHLRTRP